MEWRENLLEERERIAELLRGTRRIAVLGIKPESRADRPAHYVPRYLQEAGFEVIPVPVYYPEEERILGQPVYRRVAEVPDPLDLVNVFRKSQDIPAHIADLLEARPRAVWFQLGIRNDAAARELAEAGILVVQDRCIMVDHRVLL